MKKKETIDVYEILRECAKEDMKLWSPIVGECTLRGLRAGVRQIIVKFTDRNKDSSEWKFCPDGKTYSVGNNDNAEVCLFPSKEMRDWEKLLWKKGDVLYDVEGNGVMFDQWDDSDYSSFRALFDIVPDGAGFKISKDTEGYSTKDYWTTNDSIREDFLAIIEKHAHYKFNEKTKEFEPYFKDGDFIAGTKVDGHVSLMIFKSIQDKRILVFHFLITEGEDPILSVETVCVDEYKELRMATDGERRNIYNILANNNMRWNAETLEIENAIEPNDGDVMYLPEIENGTYPVIFIFKEIANGNIYDHASLVFENRYSPRLCVDEQNTAWESDKKYMLPATEEQKQQFFSALAKQNKKWNPETKQIEDLPKKQEFKPMDYVLIKTKGFNGRWLLAQYAFSDSKNVSFVGGLIYCIDEIEIIPYNGSTKHLLGTTEEWKGGEE